ncbi:MAG: aminopeptidase P family protein [Chloroflexota bacterium]
MNIASRLAKLQQNMAEKGIKAFLISRPEDRYYLSGFTGSDGYLLITPEASILATDARYTEQAGKEAPAYQIFRIAGRLASWLPELVSGINCPELAFQAGHLTFAIYQQMSEALAESHIRLVPTEGLVASQRRIKEAAEIDLITKAVAITDASFTHLEDVIHPGMTEKQAAWEIEKYMREHGSEAVAFEAIVAAGANSAMPHARPGERTILPGEPIVVDVGAKYNGYCSDLTRTICLGEPDDTFKKVYHTVLAAQLKAAETIQEGMTGAEADETARAVIREAGYGDNFGHGLGHGLGLVIHESPRLGPNATELLENGMVFSNEPGIYLPGWGGVRIEDTVVMEQGRVKTLSRARKISSLQ